MPRSARTSLRLGSSFEAVVGQGERTMISLETCQLFNRYRRRSLIIAPLPASRHPGPHWAFEELRSGETRSSDCLHPFQGQDGVEQHSAVAPPSTAMRPCWAHKKFPRQGHRERLCWLWCWQLPIPTIRLTLRSDSIPTGYHGRSHSTLERPCFSPSSAFDRSQEATWAADQENVQLSRRRRSALLGHVPPLCAAERTVHPH